MSSVLIVGGAYYGVPPVMFLTLPELAVWRLGRWGKYVLDDAQLQGAETTDVISIQRSKIRVKSSITNPSCSGDV